MTQTNQTQLVSPTSNLSYAIERASGATQQLAQAIRLSGSDVGVANYATAAFRLLREATRYTEKAIIDVGDPDIRLGQDL
jgi:hypothetical protein